MLICSPFLTCLQASASIACSFRECDHIRCYACQEDKVTEPCSLGDCYKRVPNSMVAYVLIA